NIIFRSRVMGTSYDPTTYLNQQATTAPSRHAQRPPRGRLRSSPDVGSIDPSKAVKALVVVSTS
ncbi:MAG: hypothetical protein WBQ89_05290, partial [Candidatus Acidiferrum sp.]